MRRSPAWPFLVLIATSVACATEGLLQIPEPFNAPIDHIDTFAYPNYIRVGDTLTVDTGAYDSTGTSTHLYVTPTWVLSDPTVGRLEAARQVQSELFRALSPGMTAVNATIGGKTGSDTVWVISLSGGVTFSLPVNSMNVGDTIIATLSIVTGSTVVLPPRRINPVLDRVGGLQVQWLDNVGHLRCIAATPGPVRLIGLLGRVADTSAALTILPRP